MLNFPTRVFDAPIEGFPLEFYNGSRLRKLDDAPTRPESGKSDDMCIRLEIVAALDGQTCVIWCLLVTKL